MGIKYNIRFIGTGLVQGNDDLLLPLWYQNARPVVDIARKLSCMIKQGSLEVIREDNMIVAKFYCWKWE